MLGASEIIGIFTVNVFWTSMEIGFHDLDPRLKVALGQC